MKGNHKEKELKDTDKGGVTEGKGARGGGGGYGGTNDDGKKKEKQLQRNDLAGICPKESRVCVCVPTR